jgi:hypothetical protein
MERVLFNEPGEVHTRLKSLGLEEAELVRVVQFGQASRAECTENHPPSYAGYTGWAETVRALREYLIPLKWTRCNDGNWPLAVSPCEKFAIAVATGNEATGLSSITPSTKASKGPRTAQAVTVNLQLAFDFGTIAAINTAIPSDLRKATGRTTWFLLIHVDRKKSELRCELARPVRMSEDGRVDDWAERIILSATPLDPDPETSFGTNGPDGPDFTAEIKRRA